METQGGHGDLAQPAERADTGWEGAQVAPLGLHAVASAAAHRLRAVLREAKLPLLITTGQLSRSPYEFLPSAWRVRS